MQMKLIVAMTPDGLIGRNDGLPWHEPADLKHFKSVTTGHAIIMGRRTYDSIGKPLPGRRNIVITRREAPVGVDGVTSLAAALDLCRSRNESIAFIIGGAMVFADAVPIVDEMVVTWIEQPGVTGETYFPKWNRDDWIAGESTPLSPTARVVHYCRRT